MALEPSWSWDSPSAQRTEEFGAALGAGAADGTVVALEGEMGVGKTTLVRGLARGLGVEGPVASPTFTLMVEYEGRLRLRHYDAFMESRERSFLLDGGADQLGAGGVSVIEWAERVREFLPEPHLRLSLSHRSPEVRRLEVAVVGEGERAQALQGLSGRLRVAFGAPGPPEGPA